MDEIQNNRKNAYCITYFINSIQNIFEGCHEPQNNFLFKWGNF